ncbi:MAG TPA: glutamate--tRNA ligase [Pantanalinema sp.]
MSIRVRFAPSPTGYLHLGGARTALFNWLLARNMGGTFVLRIEDTDVARSTEQSVQAILDGMTWLGLNWDEGPGVGGPYAPYFQMERLDTYRRYAEQLVNEGHAYHCFCTKDELDAMRAEAQAKGEGFLYRGRCRNLLPEIAQRLREEGRTPVLRFKAPVEGQTVVEDLIHGDVTFQNAIFDDFVLVKADGVPTYNYAVVIDDATMAITHVLRGDDHLSNTPKQLMIYQALGLTPPRFGHIPMILGSDRTRLSKRHGATSVMAYHDEGYLPEAMLNYLARLGWAHGDDEVFSLEDLIAKFNVKGINNTAAVFDQAKLDWLNGVWMRQLPSELLAERLKPRWQERGWLKERHTDAWLKSLVDLLKERARTLEELVTYSIFFFDTAIPYNEEAVAKFLTLENRPIIEALAERLPLAQPWDQATIEGVFRDLAIERGVKAGAVIQPARVALAGTNVSPGMFETAYLMGPELCAERLRAALERMPAAV